MALTFLDYEIPLLQALIRLGGKAKTSKVYPEIEKIMKVKIDMYPEEYQKYKKGQIVWKNKTCWAREYLTGMSLVYMPE